MRWVYHYLALIIFTLLGATAAAANCSVKDYAINHAIFAGEMSYVTGKPELERGWKNTYVHPGDANVVVRFGSVEAYAASRQDERLMEKNSEQAKRSISRLFSRSGYSVLQSPKSTTPYTWSVEAISSDGSLVAGYYSRRISDKCEFTASWSVPTRYVSYGLKDRITSALASIASQAASMADQPVTVRPETPRPSGYLPVLLGVLSCVIAGFSYFTLTRALRVYTRAYLGLYSKLSLGLGLGLASTWIAYDIFNIIRMRANSENIEILFAAIGFAIFSVVWTTTITNHQAPSFISAWLSLTSLLGMYAVLGWHWDMLIVLKWALGLLALLGLALWLFSRAQRLSVYLDRAETELQFR